MVHSYQLGDGHSGDFLEKLVRVESYLRVGITLQKSNELIPRIAMFKGNSPFPKPTLLGIHAFFSRGGCRSFSISTAVVQHRRVGSKHHVVDQEAMAPCEFALAAQIRATELAFQDNSKSRRYAWCVWLLTVLEVRIHAV